MDQHIERILASCGYDTTIRLWDPDTGQCQHLLQGHTDSVLSLAFLPDRDTLLSGSYDHTLREWETTSGRCLRIVQGYGMAFFDVAWSRDGRYLVGGGSDATLTLWSVAEETRIQVLYGHTHFVTGVAWSRDGCLLASSSCDQIRRRESLGRNNFSYDVVIMSVKSIYSLSDRTAKAVLWLSQSQCELFAQYRHFRS
jgi:WD40 repeat protein